MLSSSLRSFLQQHLGESKNVGSGEQDVAALVVDTLLKENSRRFGDLTRREVERPRLSRTGALLEEKSATARDPVRARRLPAGDAEITPEGDVHYPRRNLPKSPSQRGATFAENEREDEDLDFSEEDEEKQSGDRTSIAPKTPSYAVTK